MVVLQDVAIDAAHAAAEVVARPRRPVGTVTPGTHALDGAQLYVPPSYRPEHPVALVVMLHGAGGAPAQALGFMQRAADRDGFLVLAPQSVAETWDVIRGGFGPDVARIDRALAAVFDRAAIDPARIAIGGFSDGASYALTLGLANGALFRAVLAFSPGFAAAPRHQGTPRVFVIHGVDDRVLPIDRTSRKLVPRLVQRGQDVTYVEFDGGHVVPAAVVSRAVAWWLGTQR